MKGFFFTLSGFIAGSVAIILGTAGLLYDIKDTVVPGRSPLPTVDVIVCLAGGKGRISAAAEIWYLYWQQFPKNPPVLYISGTGPTATWSQVSKQIRKEVLEVLTPDQVVLENQSLNTDENARFFKVFSDQNDWSRLLLVTASYHMKRSILIFKQVLGAEAIIETHSVTQEVYLPGVWNKDFSSIRVTVVEYLKWIFYWLLSASSRTS